MPGKPNSCGLLKEIIEKFPGNNKIRMQKNRGALRPRDHVIFKYCLCPKFVELKPLANVEPLPYSAKIAIAFIPFFRSGRNEFLFENPPRKKTYKPSGRR